MLVEHRNPYGGVFVAGKDLPADAGEVRTQLAEALADWAGQGLQLAWLEIPGERSDIVPVALELGYEFHHCRANDLMLVRRLQPQAYVPSASTHTIGVGGLVLSEKREILVVLERRDRQNRPGHLKLPGGMLEKGEHLADGAVREVFEETGIRTRFSGLLSMRHHHRGQFGASNIYAVCRLEPQSREIRLDERELARAMWLPVDEYLASDEIGLYNRRVVEAALNREPLQPVKLDGYMDSPEDYEIFIP